MVDLELHMEDDVMSHINLDGFFGDLLEAGDIIGACSSTNASLSSPDSGLSWFDEIENILMKDDEDGGVVGGGIRADSSQEFCDRFLADVLVDFLGDGSTEIADGSGNKEEPGLSDDGWVEAAKVDGANGGDEAYDPASKKLRGQLRNRDAAVRSRERKKAYVRDLEVKSKYLEGKCRRLGRLLQCVMAENQALRFSLENNACGASVAK